MNRRPLAFQFLRCSIEERAIERPLIPAVTFDLGNIKDANCRLNFRFDRHGVQKLCVLLALPDVIITDARYRCHKDEALAIVLHRLNFPRRYHDMALMLGKNNSFLCQVFNHVLPFDLQQNEIADVFQSKAY
jgi:hypothetical protein